MVEVELCGDGSFRQRFQSAFKRAPRFAVFILLLLSLCRGVSESVYSVVDISCVLACMCLLLCCFENANWKEPITEMGKSN